MITSSDLLADNDERRRLCLSLAVLQKGPKGFVDIKSLLEQPHTVQIYPTF